MNCGQTRKIIVLLLAVVIVYQITFPCVTGEFLAWVYYSQVSFFVSPNIIVGFHLACTKPYYFDVADDSRVC